MGPSGLRSPHSQSCSGCGSWDCGSWKRCRSGCESRDCGCCSFHGCGQGLGSGCGSGLSSRCSSSWRKRRGWAGSRGWDAFGHCRREKEDPSPSRSPSSAHPWPSLGPQPPPSSGQGFLPKFPLSLDLKDNPNSKLPCPSIICLISLFPQG